MTRCEKELNDFKSWMPMIVWAEGFCWRITAACNFEQMY